MVLISNSFCIHWHDRCTVYSRVPAQERFSPGGSPGLDPSQRQKHRIWISTEVGCRSWQVLLGKAISYACGGGVGRALVKDHCGFCGNTWKLLKCRFFFFFLSDEPNNRLQGFVRATFSTFSAAVWRKWVWVPELLRMTNETDVYSIWNYHFKNESLGHKATDLHLSDGVGGFEFLELDCFLCTGNLRAQEVCQESEDLGLCSAV